MWNIGATLSFVTAGVLIYRLIRSWRQEERELKSILLDTCNILRIETRTPDDVIHRVQVLSVKQTSYGFDVVIRLPMGYALDKFQEKIPAIEQSCAAARIMVKHLRGREVLLKLGMKPIRERMDYDETLIQPGELSLPYFTPYGVRYLNFGDESTCHLIVAGATRMGKTVFLRLLFVHLMLATEGKIKFFYINNKLEDYYPLMGVPQIPQPAETVDDAFEVLREVKLAIEERKQILRSSRDAVNVKRYNELHPENPIPPLFVVFDEYGRFAESEDLQNMVMEIAETAGYLDVHLIIATQRPDATTVLKPRIRANILTRVCFQTADEKNSEIVVHSPEAYRLGEIRGRCIVLDGTPMLAQIPYISEDRAMELLQPFRSDEDETVSQRQENPGVSSSLPSFVTGPVGSASLSRSLQAVGHNQSDYETPRPRRVRHNRSKTKT